MFATLYRDANIFKPLQTDLNCFIMCTLAPATSNANIIMIDFENRMSTKKIYAILHCALPFHKNKQYVDPLPIH